MHLRPNGQLLKQLCLEVGRFDVGRNFWVPISGQLRGIPVKEIRRFTKKGYKKVKMPKLLHKSILEGMMYEEMFQEPCTFGEISMICARKNPETNELQHLNSSFKIPLKNENVIVNVIRAHLEPILSEWSEVNFHKDMTVFGVRRYTRGAQLLEHVDRLPTHIISAILQVKYSKISFYKYCKVPNQGPVLRKVIECSVKVQTRSAHSYVLLCL